MKDPLTHSEQEPKKEIEDRVDPNWISHRNDPCVRAKNAMAKELWDRSNKESLHKLIESERK